MRELEQLDNKLKMQSKASGQPGDEIVVDLEVDNQSGTNGKKMRREPGMPRKPLSAYIYFSQKARENIKKDNSKMPMASIMKEVSNRWSAMNKKERETFVTAAREDKSRYEEELGKMKNKRVKTEEEEPQKFQEEKRSFVADPDEFPSNNKVKIQTFSNNEENSYSQQNYKKMDIQKKFTEYPDNLEEVRIRSQMPNDMLPPKKSSPGQDGSIRFNLPESRQGNFNQTSPCPMPIRRDMGFMSNNSTNYNYQDSNMGSQEMNRNAFNSRSSMFSPMPFGANRSPGVSPNMAPMYSPMVRNNENFQRNYTAMGQSSIATPVTNNEMPYNDFYPISASPSGYTPMRPNLQRYPPMFSPAQNNESTPGIFGPSPSMNNMNFQSTPFNNYHRTPINNFGGGGGRPGFMINKPAPNMMPQTPDNKKQGAEVFDLNPFGPS